MATTTQFKMGRDVFALTFTLTYADTTATEVVVGGLPADCYILDYVFNVKTAFAGGTQTASLGTTTSANELVNGVSVAATGAVRPTTQVASPSHNTTAITRIYGVVGGSNTAGEVEVTMFVGSDRHRRKG